jgi:hypothetical protein
MTQESVFDSASLKIVKGDVDDLYIKYIIICHFRSLTVTAQML